MACPGHRGSLGTEPDVQAMECDLCHRVCVHKIMNTMTWVTNLIGPILELINLIFRTRSQRELVLTFFIFKVSTPTEWKHSVCGASVSESVCWSVTQKSNVTNLDN